MPQDQFKYFSDSLLSLVKDDALYSGDSLKVFKTITEEAASTLDVARASIWMFSEDRAHLTSMNMYKKLKKEHSDGLTLLQKDYPNYFKSLHKDRWIDATDANHDPRTSEFSVIYFIPVGIAAVLNIPIRFGGNVIGLLAMEHLGQTRDWSAAEINYACSLGDMVSNALEAEKRALVEDALVKSEERYRSLIEKIPDLVYEADLNGVLTFISPSVEQIMGYTVDESIGKNLVEIAYAEPEDRLKFHDAFIKNDHISDYQIKLLKKDGSFWWGQVNASVVYNDKGKPVSINGIVRNITLQKTALEKLSYQASHDSLTGLKNRRQFENEVKDLLINTREQTHDTANHTLCFMDLDQFKVVNDTSGHHAGDELLQSLASVLKSSIRKGDCLARLSGDEFGLLLTNCHIAKAEQICNAIINKVRDYQFHCQGSVFKIGSSIGLVEINKNNTDFSELFRQADSACYMAKDKGRNRIQVYRPDDQELANQRHQMGWVGRINQALDDNRFTLYAQEITPLQRDSHKHYELLIRMLDENGETIPPGAFLPAAERYSLIEKIDAWVVEHACRFIGKHADALNDIKLFSINLSGPSLNNADFMQRILNSLESNAISPSKVCFEVTETIAVSNLKSAIQFISTLRGMGFKFSLDDFGSGISSFGYLKTLPVDYLKIDGMFVKDIADDPIDFAMVKSINEIGQVMGMETIAEFVENDAIKNKLVALGVDYAQGYGIAKPIPINDLLN